MVTVAVSAPEVFQVVLRYVNRGPLDVEGRVLVLEYGRNLGTLWERQACFSLPLSLSLQSFLSFLLHLPLLPCTASHLQLQSHLMTLIGRWSQDMGVLMS